MNQTSGAPALAHDGPIIDCWVTHPTASFLAHPMFESLKRWMRIDEIPPVIPPEVTLGALDEGRISKALLCGWWGPNGPLIDNDEVAAMVAAAPDRLFGMATANLLRPMEALHEFRRCVEELGFKGLRLCPWLWNIPPNDRRYYPLFAACCEMDVPFYTQVGHAGPLCESEANRPIPYLDQVALEFPDLKIVCGHVGFPWVDEVISLCLKYPNVYVDTSAYKPSRYPPAFLHYLKGAGKKKVLFGSNFPMLRPAECLAELPSLGLGAEALALLLHGNASRVFRL